MLFTERRAIEEMFNNLEAEKKEVKRQARLEIDSIEERQERLLSRLERLDNQEREAVDTESVLLKLVQTAEQLGELIPQVPAGDVIERAAAKIAANPEAAATIHIEKEEESIVSKAAREQKLNSKPAPPAQIDRDQAIRIITNILKEQNGEKMKLSQLEKEFLNRTGKKYYNFSNRFSDWKKDIKNLKRIGHSYLIETNIENIA